MKQIMSNIDNKIGCVGIGCAVIIILLFVVMLPIVGGCIALVYDVNKPYSDSYYYEKLNEKFCIDANTDNSEIISAKYQRNIDKSFCVCFRVNNQSLVERIEALESELSRQDIIDNYLSYLCSDEDLVDGRLLEMLCDDNSCIVYSENESPGYSVLISLDGIVYYICFNW